MTDIKRNGDNPLDATTANKPDAEKPPTFSQEGVLMVDDLNVTEYISSQLKPLIDRIEQLEQEVGIYSDGTRDR